MENKAKATNINGTQEKENKMENVAQKVVENNRELRVKNVASRMVGMYRLIDEQFKNEGVVSDELTSQFTSDSHSKREWTRFKDIFMDLLQERLLAPEKMAEVVRHHNKTKQGVKGLLYPNKINFPEQAINIRMGFLMQEALKRYIALKAEPLSKDVWETFTDFASKKIEWDLSFKKDNTVFVLETKYNFNLDTEKTDKIVEKLDTFSIFLKKHYKNQDVKTVVGLVSLTYPTATDVPNKAIKPALRAVKDSYILGYADLLDVFGIKVTKKMWSNFHSNVVSAEIVKAYNRVTA